MKNRASEIFNLDEFHESTNNELIYIRNRVRNLIGNKNWGYEGLYKEAILRNVIKRFLPPRYIVGTGFIVNSLEGKIDCSTQIDILIFDSEYPVLFSEGDFYIVTASSVRAVIEVKTNMRNQITDTIKKTNAIGEFLSKYKEFDMFTFLGIFSFEGNYPNESESIKNRIEDKIRDGIEDKCYINHISLNEDIFIKLRPKESSLCVYKLRNLSFSYFISNIIHFTTLHGLENNGMWFPRAKELLFCLDKMKVDENIILE